jgi:hypothetical protein
MYTPEVFRASKSEAASRGVGEFMESGAVSPAVNPVVRPRSF